MALSRINNIRFWLLPSSLFSRVSVEIGAAADWTVSPYSVIAHVGSRVDLVILKIWR